MAIQSSPKIMFRKNASGRPIPGSNSKRTIKPFGNWDVVTSVVNGPSPVARLRFPGNKRYFVLLDSQGLVIDGSLLESTNVPNVPHLEVFTNGIITLSNDNATNSGYIAEDPEELLGVPLTISQDFQRNGYTSFQKGKKDNTPPSVFITGPASGTTFPINSQVTIFATATDNVAIRQVDFIMNIGTPILFGQTITDTTSPYSATFTMPNVACPSITIFARAVDTSGNTTISPSIIISCQ